MCLPDPTLNTGGPCAVCCRALIWERRSRACAGRRSGSEATGGVRSR
jgi:tRNA(Arg) A34 adenosine deaminase TadA